MKDIIDTVAENNIRESFNSPARPVVTLDVEKYKIFLDDPALSEAEKENFLQALWSIIVTFVDLGFGVHPLQEVCVQENEHSDDELKEAFDRADGVDSYRRQKKDGGLAGGLEME